ncbi:TetR/AcrR family transcriptional regulator [Phaeodactylibacter luteus]|uniref:TetR/AcrR family transcriptional regulator n=2 Tax=Phaeodactylibacter luteus TaxID=1564516 RepID=A0A5C6RPQ6_9BACT|nr:TetR/AcrR family transcriptional regulator [Phaeodactylibacter luteus]
MSRKDKEYRISPCALSANHLPLLKITQMGKKYMEPTTEEKILEAARKVFMNKGFAAARMQEIADTAAINKGLLHYYYRSKNKLFRAVFDEAFAKFSAGINEVFEADLPLFEKIEQFVDRYMDLLMDNPNMPAFVISEINQKGGAFAEDLLSRRQRPNPMPLIAQVQAEAAAGHIRQVNPISLVMNLLSMCVFPFLARPMFQGLMGVDAALYQNILQQRKKEVAAFTINAIRLD